MRDLPWSEYRTTVVIELYRVRCPDCGIKAERVAQLPSKAPFSKRFEEAVGQACESAAVRTSGAAVGLSREYGASDGFAVSGALGTGATSTGVAADGSGRDLPGEEAEVSDGSDEPGDGRATVPSAPDTANP